MSIRTRLTLWYAGTLLVSLLVLAALSYHELVIERMAEASHVPAEEQAREELGDEVRIFLTVGLPALALSLTGGWLLTRKALNPLARLSEAASRIHAGNLTERLPEPGTGDELDRITRVFNDMTARLDGSFRHIREFTLHASHELKTPLTILRGEMETTLREEPLTEAQRERLFGQLDELQRLAHIVDGLTLLTKADAGEVAIKREALAFDELVRDSVEDAQTLGQVRGLTVTLESAPATTVFGDRHRLRQLLLNLADNAVKYCDTGGRVTFALRRAGAQAELRIGNTGPGVAPELQGRVFERFFRGDPSHCHDTEGSGLGLSIAGWIVKAHAGTIRLESDPGLKTTVTVCLPLAAADRPQSQA